MKVLLVTLEYPPTIGGISTYLKELYRNFPGTVRVVSPHTHRIYTRFFYPHWLLFYFDLKKIVALEQPDELHISHVLPIGRMARWILRSQKIPYRVFVHGTDLQAAFAQPRKWRSVIRILKDAKTCFANSEATKQLYIELCGNAAPEPVVLTPGVAMPHPNSEFAEELVRGHGLLGRRIILFVGRLVPRKGLLVAVRAFSIVLKIPVAATLVVVGEGPERVKAEQLAKELGINEHVRFVGAVSDLEKSAWYKVATVFWFPAQIIAGEWEGYGITSLEAQAAGCPVVVSAVQGLVETVQPGVTGFVVEPTAEAFAEQSLVLLQDATEWQNMRRAARVHAAEHGWEKQRLLFAQLLGLKKYE